MRIVVTGATGNVGTAVLARLHAAREVTSIVGIARRLPDQSAAPYSTVEWHSVDVGSVEALPELRRILAGADAVIHLAWALQPNHDEPVMRRTNVRGTAHVLEAAADVDLPQVVIASSVGTYSLGPKRRRVDESWPTGGMPTSHYARYKAMNERAMDEFELEHPNVVLTRLRPGLIFQKAAAAEIKRLFLGERIPTGWLRRVGPKLLPLPSQFVVQAVHATDVADAYWRAIERRASGAFNIAAEPVLTPDVIAAAIGARRTVPFRAATLRWLMSISWRMRLQASDPGWLDIATATPVMSTERARRVLGWSPAVTATDALAELVDAIGDGDGFDASPQLRPPT